MAAFGCANIKPCFLVSTHSHPKVAADKVDIDIGETAWFQHTATRRWLPFAVTVGQLDCLFQHTATRRWLLWRDCITCYGIWFQHTATRRWLPDYVTINIEINYVSTHSHPKVAARISHVLLGLASGFNTQPPEGGCTPQQKTVLRVNRFNTQPPEGGCLTLFKSSGYKPKFQHTATRRWLQMV